MKLPNQVAAVIREATYSTVRASTQNAGVIAQGPECPPGSGVYCLDGQTCTYNPTSRHFVCTNNM